MSFEEMGESAPPRLKALGSVPRAELLHVVMLPDFERADLIGEFWGYPETPHLRRSASDARNTERRLRPGVAADPLTYRDGLSHTEVRVNHARIGDLQPDTEYVYAVRNDGATPELGTFRTAPSGRTPLRFTSFGDQSTPTLDTLKNGVYVSDNRGSPAAADITAAVERMTPLFNLVNGDLCYANLSHDRVRTWSDWLENNSRSARHRP